MEYVYEGAGKRLTVAFFGRIDARSFFVPAIGIIILV